MNHILDDKALDHLIHIDILIIKENHHHFKDSESEARELKYFGKDTQLVRASLELGFWSALFQNFTFKYQLRSFLYPEWCAEHQCSFLVDPLREKLVSPGFEGYPHSPVSSYNWSVPARQGTWSMRGSLVRKSLKLLIISQQDSFWALHSFASWGLGEVEKV